MENLKQFFDSQAQSETINSKASPDDILSGMLDVFISNGEFGPMPSKYYFTRKYSDRRHQMIENFSSVDDPKIVTQIYKQKFKLYKKSGEQQKDLIALQKKKKFAIPQMKINPIELLSYQKIATYELKIEKVHYYRYLVLNVQENCFKKNEAFYFLANEIEDSQNKQMAQSDNSERLSSVLKCKVSKMDDDFDIRHFQSGRKFVVLDPQFKFGNDCIPYVNIDNIKKLILLEDTQTFDNIIEKVLITKNALDLKNLGNKQFESKKYEAAINLYTFGITKAKSEDDQQLLNTLLGNRCQSYLNIRQYEQSLKDCQEALQIDPGNIKNKYRFAKAIGFLDREEEALNILHQLLEQTRDIKSLHEDVQKAILLIQDRLNQSSGIYNLSRLMEQAKNLKSISDIEVKEFIGPIEIGFVEGKNRGIIAKEDIKKGQLVLVEKAFSTNEMRQDSNFDPKQCLVFLTDFTNVPLFRNTHIQLLENPNAEKLVKYLYNGQNGKLQVDIQELAQKQNLSESQQSLTYQQMSKMLKYNFCGCPSLLRNLELLKAFERKEEEKIEYINAIQPILSFFNHDCYANTSRFSIGDAAFIVAKKDIKKGEELTQFYISLALPFDEREQLTQKAWGFECRCNSCIKYLQLPDDLQQLLKSVNMQPSNARKQDEMMKELIRNLPIVTSKLTQLDLQNSYLSDYYLMLQIGLAQYTMQRDEQNFLRYYEIFKHFGDLWQISKLKSMAQISFGPKSLIYKTLCQSYKEQFMIEFCNDQELFKKYG
eukprot:403354753